jgi:hypothetical protein
MLEKGASNNENKRPSKNELLPEIPPPKRDRDRSAMSNKHQVKASQDRNAGGLAQLPQGPIAINGV